MGTSGVSEAAARMIRLWAASITAHKAAGRSTSEVEKRAGHVDAPHSLNTTTCTE